MENDTRPDATILRDEYLLNIPSDLHTPETFEYLQFKKQNGGGQAERICRFDVLGITESHLNSFDADHEIYIDGYKFARLS